MSNAEKFWNRIARKYAAKPVDDEEGYLQSISHTRQYLEKHHRVLEIGCGTGSRALELCADVESYHATDFAYEMISIANERKKQTGSDNITFSQSDVYGPGLKTGSYDVVLAYNLLHLVDDLSMNTARIHQLLKPGGIFISKTPCLMENGRMMSVLAITAAFLFGVKHLKCFEVDHLKNCLSSAGFQVIDDHQITAKPVRYFAVARK